MEHCRVEELLPLATHILRSRLRTRDESNPLVLVTTAQVDGDDDDCCIATFWPLALVCEVFKFGLDAHNTRKLNFTFRWRYHFFADCMIIPMVWLTVIQYTMAVSQTFSLGLVPQPKDFVRPNDLATCEMTDYILSWFLFSISIAVSLNFT